ncbi:wax ester synthase/diacylglycerol acyltransferase 6-like isoform X2 [Nicotiana sylvestris]|nr:PREDICTED: O-acyltransferase WSD1-like isoform X2 [Nicotiana sylvestris]XP_016473323.1 PREDICTED: O-acyltransferase WSD1-like isoform X2 [Nicotiana tabacum]
MERGENKMALIKPIRTTKKLDANGGEEEALLMSPTSRTFHEPNYNLYVLAILGWKVPINVDAMKAEIQSKLLKHPRFSSLQVIDESDDSRNMKWIPTTVNLDDHVIVPDLKPNPNNMDTDKLVEDYISNLSAVSIDMSKPLWDLHILNVKTSHAEATCIFRLHHSIGDGVSLVSLLLSCFRKSSDPTSLPTLLVSSSSSSKGKSNLSNNRGSIWSLMWQYLVKLWSCISLLFNTVVDVPMFVATALFLKDSQSPFTVPQGFKSSTRLRFVYRTVSLDDIKFIKNLTNSTVNDVILGITQAALSRYVHRKYEIEGKRKFSPQKMRCRASVVMNLRPLLGVQAVAEMIEKNTVVIQGNCFGIVIIPLSISQFDNPLDYVRKAKTTMDRKKHSLESRCTFYLSQLLTKLFGFKGAAALAPRALSHTTLFFSNVLGPLEEVSWSRHPLAFIAPTCYGQST